MGNAKMAIGGGGGRIKNSIEAEVFNYSGEAIPRNAFIQILEDVEVENSTLIESISSSYSPDRIIHLHDNYYLGFYSVYTSSSLPYTYKAVLLRKNTNGTITRSAVVTVSSNNTYSPLIDKFCIDDQGNIMFITYNASRMIGYITVNESSMSISLKFHQSIPQSGSSNTVSEIAYKDGVYMFIHYSYKSSSSIYTYAHKIVTTNYSTFNVYTKELYSTSSNLEICEDIAETPEGFIGAITLSTTTLYLLHFMMDSSSTITYYTTSTSGSTNNDFKLTKVKQYPNRALLCVWSAKTFNTTVIYIDSTSSSISIISTKSITMINTSLSTAAPDSGGYFLELESNKYLWILSYATSSSYTQMAVTTLTANESDVNYSAAVKLTNNTGPVVRAYRVSDNKVVAVSKGTYSANIESIQLNDNLAAISISNLVAFTSTGYLRAALLINRVCVSILYNYISETKYSIRSYSVDDGSLIDEFVLAGIAPLVSEDNSLYFYLDSLKILCKPINFNNITGMFVQWVKLYKDLVYGVSKSKIPNKSKGIAYIPVGMPGATSYGLSNSMVDRVVEDVQKEVTNGQM